MADTLRRNFYVDDMLKSIPTEEEAIDVVRGAKSMCEKGVFNPVSSIYIYIYGVRSSGHPTGQKVQPNTADMEALSYVGFSPPAQFLL